MASLKAFRLQQGNEKSTTDTNHEIRNYVAVWGGFSASLPYKFAAKLIPVLDPRSLNTQIATS
ncbi:hypothetical protein NIES4106_21220 [Fischerella sp. NIES-4106]|jgi:hypothetical protein|nr:hypothetical protein NIES4106_21220 [Fischerella sp. NIES-4106]